MKTIPENQKNQGQATSTVQMYPTNLTYHIKALNRKSGRGSYHVRIKYVKEYNAIIIKLTDGTTIRATSFIDIGHTNETKKFAIQEMYDTVKTFLEI